MTKYVRYYLFIDRKILNMLVYDTLCNIVLKLNILICVVHGGQLSLGFFTQAQFLSA